MPKYDIKFSKKSKSPIELGEGTIDDTSLDIALFGRIRLEYGERLNQNILNILERFAVGGTTYVTPSPSPTPTPTPIPDVTPTPSPVVVMGAPWDGIISNPG